MEARGFILQPSYRIVRGKPIVHLYGVLESGAPFLVRDRALTSHFWIRSSDVERAVGLGVTAIEASDVTSLDGRPTARVEVPTPPETPAIRDLLSDNGVPTYEADVRFAMRFLIDRQLRGSVRIRGDAEPWPKGSHRGWRFDDPVLEPSAWTPSLSVLSIDIETDPKARRLLSIALVGCGASEVFLFCPEGYPSVPGAVPFADEASLLAAFVRRVRALDPDIVTGWNVVDFDLAVLGRIGRRWGVALALGRDKSVMRLRESRAAWSSREAIITGRVVLDGIQLVRGAFVKLERYGLDAVARAILGEGKGKTKIAGEDDDGVVNVDRARAILDAFKHRRQEFVDYNRTDAQLVKDILERLNLIDLAVERSKLTGLPLDRIAGSIAAFDFLYLEALHQRGIVAPSVRDAPHIAGSTGQEVNLGGHVLEPKPGLYENVLVYDFKSLYPSIIRTFQIDPLGFVDGHGDPDQPSEPDAMVAPNGARFRRRTGILTEILDVLFPRREAAKAAGDPVASQAIKILMNSFYGVLGTTACRFYRPQLAGAITAFGRELLLWSKAWFEDQGHTVLYGDTDSLFVRLSSETEVSETEAESDPLTDGEIVRLQIAADLDRWIAERWSATSTLELELETCYRRLLLPAMRSGAGGARKRYAGLVGDDEEAKVVFTGLEAVRSDWTDLAKSVQRGLYTRLFHDRPVESYLSEVVTRLRDGELDEQLVYRKRLRKPVEEYTSTTPPHVAAARQAGTRPRGEIRYVMTTGGAEPAASRVCPIDHEHYVAKQIRPVAEPVLAVLGLEFDRVVGDDAQLSLFE